MIFRLAAYFVASAAFGWAAFKINLDFKYEDYKDYIVLISSVSGMVFTLMGIWIAFLYPNAMNRIVNPKKLAVADFTESRSDAKRLESIVGAVMISALALMATLLITLAKLILFMTSLYLNYRIEFKSIALSALIFITLSQLEAVIHVVLANVMFINDLHFKRQLRQADEEL